MDEAWSTILPGLHAGWVSSDVYYDRYRCPSNDLSQDTTIHVWRGETVGLEALVYSTTPQQQLTVQLTAWKKGRKKKVSASQGMARFVNYVLTDDFKKCGQHPDTFPPRLVPDVIDEDYPHSLQACSVRPVWCRIDVPRSLAPGRYQLELKIGKVGVRKPLKKLAITIIVTDEVLPPAREWAFHTDLWQQPYAVSRFYGVERWSDKHFELLKPYLKQLARAGQKVVSTILFDEPWGEQSNDRFDAMIKSVKHQDGTWSYDYSVFDRWVELCASCGIDRQINCYSMVPWDMTFSYFDESKGKNVQLKTTTDAKEYAMLWTPFLKAFANHLKEKGWYDKTCIAMDERALPDMLRAYELVQKAVPGMKMALAGFYHQELTDKLYDYCIAFGDKFTQEELKMRNQRGWVSTTYTACCDLEPNLFTNSNPLEAEQLPIWCVEHGLDGFLHWAWMNWTDDPLRDSRFRMFPPGDTYFIYPGDRSSVRFEKFIMGVQKAEKMLLKK